MPTRHQPDRCIGGITNAERAADGGNALLHFAAGQYHSPSGEDITTALTDLVCSLLHFLGSMGYDDPIGTLMSTVRRAGHHHYYAETEGEPHETEAGEICAEEPPFADAPPCAPQDWMQYLRGGVA